MKHVQVADQLLSTFNDLVIIFRSIVSLLTNFLCFNFTVCIQISLEFLSKIYYFYFEYYPVVTAFLTLFLAMKHALIFDAQYVIFLTSCYSDLCMNRPLYFFLIFLNLILLLCLVLTQFLLDSYFFSDLIHDSAQIFLFPL
jgi:hypothetical protein